MEDEISASANQEEVVPGQQQEAAATEQGQENEQEHEQGAAPQDDAAFLAGFAVGSGEEPEPESAPAPEQPKLYFGKYTESEAQALLEQAGEVAKIREREAKVFGTLGSLKQAIDQLRQQPTAQAAPRINAQLTRLSAEFPEMAAMLQEDLAEAMQGGAPAQDSGAIERLVSERLEVMERKSEQKLLSVMHPDWRSIPASAEFTQWKGTLTPDELQVVSDSWDAIALGESLSKFKAWKAQTTKNKQSRQSRLESAITPKGVTQMAPTTTEGDAFLAGFKSVRGV